MKTIWSGVVAASLLAAAVPVAAQRTVVRVPVAGDVEMGLAPFIERALDEAATAGAAAVVLEIETPGGRVDAAERITAAISRAEVPVYAYVNMHAYFFFYFMAISELFLLILVGSVMGAVTPVDG
ncbi:MAG: hypothetical protein F4Z32_00990, partial [Gemmatimonadetes bacterium]|nr:hypothetical protein [Gemmatimonadota bacterium]